MGQEEQEEQGGQEEQEEEPCGGHAVRSAGLWQRVGGKVNRARGAGKGWATGVEGGCCGM